MNNDCPPPWNTAPIDVDLRIVFVPDFGGWWGLERAEHDGQRWEEGILPRAEWQTLSHRQVLSTPEREYQARCIYSCASARLDKTTWVEGPEHEIPQLLCAVKTWTSDSCKRWAIETDGDTALVWSPRNSETSTRVTRRALEAMVAEYEARTGGDK